MPHHDNWLSKFNHYQELQRQVREAREQQLAEQQQLAAQKAQEQQLAREKERRLAEQRMAERRQPPQEKRPDTSLNKFAEQLRASDLQRQEVQREVQKRVAEHKSQQSQVWVGWDGQKFKSPAEKAFWDAWKTCGYWDELPLVTQHPILKYRADFADLTSFTVIEIDGRSHHTDAYTFTKDRVRDRYMQKQGWGVIRFSAQEVFTNVEGVALAAFEFVSDRRDKAR